LTARRHTRVRALARRLRATLAGLGANRAMGRVRRIARHLVDIGGLRVRGAGSYLGAKRQWTHLLDQAAGLPPASEKDIRVDVVDPRHWRDADVSNCERVCFVLPSTAPVSQGWVARLAAQVDDSTVAAAPQVVHPRRSLVRATPHDAHVRQLGFDVVADDGAPSVVARDAGHVATLGRPPVRVAGASAAGLVVDRRALEAVGGLPECEDPDIAVFELCRRLRARGGRIVAVPDAVVVDDRAVSGTSALTRPLAADSAAWRRYVERHGPALMRDAAPLPGDGLRIALTVAAPSAKVASRWGDWHLAQAFARSLRTLGHLVRVQTFDHADDLASRSSDVHCVLRGLRGVRRSPGQAHVLWIISHPDTIDVAECDEADLVLVASRRFAEELRGRTRTPVEVMLQATDATRFHPMSGDPGHVHDVAVVAKSRDVYRTAVADAISAGLRPAVYGSGWDGLIDPALIAGEYVANEELPVVYASIGVLLNDHWRDMREHGFVSNRLFDALACGTPVISDDVPEIAEIFGDVVRTYHDPAELRALVEATLADPAAARERAARGGELVRDRHTFDQRAAQFSEILKRHGLDREPRTRPTP